MEKKFDVEEIKSQVEKVLKYSQYNLELYGVKEIINKWLDAKQTFIHHMGGQLIWEYPEPVSFELDEKAKRNKLEQFADLVEYHYNNFKLAHFLEKISYEDFYNNKTSTSYYIQDDLIIPANYKTVKAFKFFISDSDLLKEVQDKASQIIQENVLTGKFCVSVHPLDFLSASENVYNWRSCHSLDGDYRSGNLNYLVDNSTVMCYLRGERNAILPHFPDDLPWNSKKWRTWFFFSNDKTMMFAGRQYPFTADQGIELFREKILPKLKFDNWTPYSRDKIYEHTDSYSGERFFFNNLIPIGHVALPIRDLVKDGPFSNHYNDILQSSFYEPLYSYRRKSAFHYSWEANEATGMSNERTRFIIGNECPCPICGSNPIEYGDTMACSPCAERFDLLNNEDYEECEVCGNHIYYDDMITLDISGIRVCPDCYLNATSTCQICGTVDLPEYIKYRDGDDRCLCESCYEETMAEPKIVYGGIR